MDEITMLRGTRPDAPPLPNEARTRVRAQILAAARNEQLSAAGGLPASGRRGTRRLRGWPRLALAGGLTAALAVGFTVVQDVGVDGRPPAARQASAAEVLEHAARVVEARPDQKPRPNQWVYEKLATSMGTDKLQQENWQRFDGGKWATVDKEGTLRVKSGLIDKGRAPKATWTYLKSLPAKPSELLVRLRQDIKQGMYEDFVPGAPGDEFFVINELIRTSVLMPARTLATLFRAIARIPGVGIERNATDGIGRQGTGVTLRGSALVAIFKARTYAYLGYRQAFKPGASWKTLGEFPGTNEKPETPELRQPGKHLLLLGARAASGLVDKPGQRP